ncbi:MULTISPECIES: DNA recombination protein RmuC [unclassified Chelatococcus]|uniref:DNA recombination protein RmuC n=1 Tax=unclassified Chelatococcus TaxID=2638111 RepID=UPI001BD0A38D|nr:MULTISPECIES: DNA recombination protein RmuC [unclassified Chelatococcus]CAH1652023.1 DNA recombination protein RmuC [Hyphomicrobiales bacterium]MBS7739929.1 DNA recombination protein RmuC [Chelatococcus sp. HY11]MBX3545633.1 DNA recombination protein RmuC [Chelatococcus sp.]MCO5078771.1 DNA recombination protein RmuC [Chelatococcus sp.]CAH1686110.1 DNA recombination protein RmuC [Hyphomicrobiales bacterium]
MNQTLFNLAGYPLTAGEVIVGAAGAAVVILLLLAVFLARTNRERRVEAAEAAERAREMDDKVAELNRIQAEMTGRLQTIAEIFGSRQQDFARFVAERLDGLQHRVGQGLEVSSRTTGEHIARLNERLAVIDAAQKNLTNLTGEVVGLKDILANKQARGAYGQGRMEAIVRDGLPAGHYAFQATLRNGRRPDCLIRLPGDHPLVIDAKFPLESFLAFRGGTNDEMRRAAAARVKADVATHVKDIAEKYLVPGETQDLALLFVPSEAIYADLQEHFEDVVARAHRARVIIVSPSLLALAIQVMQSLVRDARMREEAETIQLEVRRILEDVVRLRDRVEKLDTHFRQAQEDVAQIRTSTDKIVKRGERIEALDFEDRGASQEIRAAE